jgi:MFS family permease
MTDVAGGAAAAGGWSPERSAAGGHNPYLIAFVVSIATFMEVLDTTIANVALRHIAGGLAVGIDESTYVITSYLVANAIVLSISGWLATVVGRKRFYMNCVGVFSLASLLCGFAWSLQSLVFFRILQRLGGGGMATSEQAILADSFPPHKRGQAFAIYGVAVVVAPVVGPIATTQMLPQLLQTELNYTALLAGLVLSPGGVVTMIMMPIAGRLVSTVQPKYLLVFGACVIAFAMWHLTGLTGDITYGYAAMSRVMLGVGLPFLFLPVTTAS